MGLRTVKIGDRITSIYGSDRCVFAVVTKIGTAHSESGREGLLRPDEPAFSWHGIGPGAPRDGWDRVGTEGYEWARGWEGEAVDALISARALVEE